MYFLVQKGLPILHFLGTQFSTPAWPLVRPPPGPIRPPVAPRGIGRASRVGRCLPRGACRASYLWGGVAWGNLGGTHAIAMGTPRGLARVAPLACAAGGGHQLPCIGLWPAPTPHSQQAHPQTWRDWSTPNCPREGARGGKTSTTRPRSDTCVQ